MTCVEVKASHHVLPNCVDHGDIAPLCISRLVVSPPVVPCEVSNDKPGPIDLGHDLIRNSLLGMSLINRPSLETRPPASFFDCRLYQRSHSRIESKRNKDQIC